MGTDKELTRKAFLKLSASAALVTVTGTGCPGGDENGDGSTTGEDTEGPTMSGPPTPSTSSGSPSTTNDPGESTTTGIDDPTMDSTPPGDTTTTSGGDEFPPLTSSSSSTGTAGPTDTGGPDCSTGASDTLISGNHGHAANIDAAMLVPATPIDLLDIQADADHAHTISLTGDEVDMLLAGMEVTVTSSFDGHSHNVTLSC